MVERNKKKKKKRKKSKVPGTKVGPCWKIEHGLLIEQKEEGERWWNDRVGNDGARGEELESRYHWRVCFETRRSEIRRRCPSGSRKVPATRGWITATKSNETTLRRYRVGKLDCTITRHGRTAREKKERGEKDTRGRKTHEKRERERAIFPD